VDFGKLAIDLTAYLVPLLPYLQQAGGKMAEEVGTKVGEGAWSRAKALWEKLWPRVEAKESAREAVADLAKRPDDPRVKGAVEIQLEKILEAEPGLAGELAQLLEAAGPRASWAHLVGDGAIAQGAGAVAAGKGGMAAGRDLVIGGPGGTGKRD
jgi:hypothetical protein